MRVPSVSYFWTVYGLADCETMKLYGPFCGYELEDVKRELLETLFKVQSCVIALRERFVRFAAQVLNTADEQPTLPAEFAVDRTLRTASQLDDLVDSDAFIAVLQKQVCGDSLKLAVSIPSSRPLVRRGLCTVGQPRRILGYSWARRLSPCAELVTTPGTQPFEGAPISVGGRSKYARTDRRQST